MKPSLLRLLTLLPTLLVVSVLVRAQDTALLPTADASGFSAAASGAGQVPPAGPAAGESPALPAAAAQPLAPAVYLAADEMPGFPGGDAALLQFLKNKLHYPAEALDRSLSGKVHVAFTVDTAGHFHDIRVVRGLGAGLDQEALRLVRLMPWWTPGRVQGRPVWVALTIPITFRTL